MTIKISPELRSMMDLQLEEIKQMFLREQFAFSPIEAERFEITEVEEECLVYPRGTFKVEGYYTYSGKSFFLQTYVRGDESSVTLIGDPEPVNFSSMEKAVTYCKNSIDFVPAPVGEKFPVMAKSFKILIDSLVENELSSLPEEDSYDISLYSYDLSHLIYSDGRFEDNLYFGIHLEYKGRYHIKMTVTTIDNYEETGKERYGMYFNILGQHQRPFSSLKEVVKFIKEEVWDVPKDLSLVP